MRSEGGKSAEEFYWSDGVAESRYLGGVHRVWVAAKWLRGIPWIDCIGHQGGYRSRAAEDRNNNQAISVETGSKGNEANTTWVVRRLIYLVNKLVTR